jgi:hypothetical protein
MDMQASNATSFLLALLLPFAAVAGRAGNPLPAETEKDASGQAPTNSPASPIKVTVGARVYFESAYLSSSGTMSYTKPVAEQVAWVYANMGDFGYATVDGWLCSALNGQTDHIHRRAFYCYEGTARYGYVLRFTESVKLDTNGGLLWDWLGGYRNYHHTPLAILAMQHLRNPIITPYWNLLHRFDDARYVRIRTGVEQPFTPLESVTLRPYIESIWGDASRYKRVYRDSPSYCFLNGSYMVGVVGLLAEWRFTDNWYLWGRFRQFLTVNPAARSLAHKRDTIVHHTDYSIYGIGIGCSF